LGKQRSLLWRFHFSRLIVPYPGYPVSSRHRGNEVNLTLSRKLEIQAFPAHQAIDEHTKPGSQAITFQQPLTDSGMKLIQLFNKVSDSLSGNLLFPDSTGERQQECGDVNQGHGDFLDE